MQDHTSTAAGPSHPDDLGERARSQARNDLSRLPEIREPTEARPRINRLAEFADEASERAFGDELLPRDRALTTLGMAVAGVLIGAYAYTDLTALMGSDLLQPHLILRGGVVVATLTAIALIHGGSRRMYDIATTLWGLSLCAAVLAIDALRPPGYVLHIAIDNVLLLAVYVVFMTRFRYQLALGLLFGGGLMIIAQTKQVPDSGVVSLLVSTGCLSLFGLILCWRFHWLDRKSFADRAVERELRHRMEAMAFTDPLTEIANRRAFMARCAAELERYGRHQRPFSLLLLDLDHFKRINDEHGHSVGDAFLREFAGVLDDLSRTTDLPARLGGEEFAILLAETDLADAETVATRVLERTRTLEVIEAPDAQVTVSIGVTEVRVDDSAVDDLLGRADRSLYGAKDLGRDRMVSAPPEGPAQSSPAASAATWRGTARSGAG